MIHARSLLLLTFLLAGPLEAAACPSDLDEFGIDGRAIQPPSLVGSGSDATVTGRS